jgi:simple sugar transport system permease protein
MTAATSPINLEAPKTWRDYLPLTRMSIFAVLFIIVGAWILLSVPRNVAGDASTLLTIDRDGTQGISVPVVPFAAAVALSYLVCGLVGLLPNPGLKRLTFWWMLVNALLIIPTVLVIIAAGGKTNIVVMLQESVRLATPIVLGALAGLWCERSGVTNIAIEGMMLTGACIGFITYSLLIHNVQGAPATQTEQYQFVAVIAAVLSGGLMALLHGWLSITFKTNQIVSGTVINILAIGLTSFLRLKVLASSRAGRNTLESVAIPGLKDIPIVGDVFFNGKPIFYGMFILLAVTHITLYYTRWGLRTRAVGENPHAADTLGINVNRNRWINVIIGGLIAGLAGAWFSLETTGSFDDQMTSGRGFIALAAMIFGKWTPIGAFGGGLLFGFSDALGQRFQFLGVQLPPQFLQMVPYFITIVVLSGLIGKATPPKADGVPFEKE